MTNRTPAQLSLIHTAESAGISAFMTLIGGVYQYVFTNGLNIGGLLGFLGTSFVACMLMMYKSVKSNPQLAQAALDTANEAKAVVQQAIPFLHQHLPEPVLLSTNPPASTVPSSAAAQPAPVQITPNPAWSAASSVNPFASSPLPPQQQFPSRFTANEVPTARG